jgi:hypothetical protein
MSTKHRHTPIPVQLSVVLDRFIREHEAALKVESIRPYEEGKHVGAIEALKFIRDCLYEQPRPTTSDRREQL